MAYGPGESRFVEEKRHFEKPIPISDLVFLDRERCILCDRCTRFAERGRRRSADQLHGPRQRDAGAHVPGRAVRVLLLGQHRADLPGRRAHREAVPLQGPAVGPRAGRVDVHHVLGRLPRHGAVVARPCAAVPGRRHRSGQLGLAVRQGPLRLRSDRARRAPARRRCSATATTARRGLVASRARPGRDCDPRGDHRRRARLGRGDRRGAAHQRRRLRVGEAREGGDRHRQRRRPARRRPRPPRSSSGFRRDHRRGVRGRHAARARARPEGRAARPVPPGARRASQKHGLRVVELSPTATSLTPLAAASLRYRPGEQAALVDVPPVRRHAVPRVSAPTGSRRRRTSSCSRVVRRSPRPATPTEAAIAAAVAARPDGSLPRRVAPRQRARRDRHGPRAGSAARPGGARRGTGLVRRRTGASVPAKPGPRHRPRSSGPRPTVASGASCCSAPTRSPTSPIAGSPSGRWPASTALIGVDTFLTAVARAARLWCSRPRASPRSAARTTNLEGRVSLLAQKVTPPGTARADWMIAAELAVLLGGDLGLESVEAIWAEIEEVSSAHAGDHARPAPQHCRARRRRRRRRRTRCRDAGRRARDGVVHRRRQPSSGAAAARRLLSAAGVGPHALRPRRGVAALAVARPASRPTSCCA